jgi:hypothetical protein
VTAWLAAQAVADGALPEEQPATSPPIRCGSMQTNSVARASPAR